MSGLQANDLGLPQVAIAGKFRGFTGHSQDNPGQARAASRRDPFSPPGPLYVSRHPDEDW
jgi:hypothetical protein